MKTLLFLVCAVVLPIVVLGNGNSVSTETGPSVTGSEQLLDDSKKCNKTCKVGNQTECWPVPCPLPPCDKPVQTPGDCCPHCPPCPYPCQVNGHHFCYPPPCPPPACVDSVTTRGDCCEHCPNGPNCGKDGQIIPWKHWRIIDGKNCTCVGPLDPKCV